MPQPGNARRRAGRLTRFAAPIIALACLGAGAGSAFAEPGVPATAVGERPEPLSRAETHDAIREASDAEAADDGAGGVALPSGLAEGDDIFPDYRVVSVYGLPGGFGIVGRESISANKDRLRDLRNSYENQQPGRQVLEGFDIVATIANSNPGPSGKYRSRLDGSIIRDYLHAARDLNGRLILDIQPGRSSFKREMRAHKKWLEKPDVDVALDPEWNVGDHGVPGEDAGSVGSGNLNRCSKWLRDLVRRNDLPEKLMIVHQFREGSIKRRDEVKQRGAVGVTLNFDGIGSPAAKEAGYRNLRQRGLWDGFSLFYELDTQPIMSPSDVVDLRPRADYVMYQ